MKLEHTKEFNAEHAKAGAPYCQRNGLSARIGIWDSNNENFPLVGVRTTTPGYHDSTCSWSECGGVWSSDQNESDLVMLPLGYCEGKPVFVGEELVYINSVIGSIVMDAGCRHFADFKWPRMAPVMPNILIENYGFSLTNTAFNNVALDHRSVLEAYWKALDEYEATK